MIPFNVPLSLKIVTPAIFCFLSAIGSISIIVCYRKVVRMRHNAGKITLFIVLCELALSLLYSLSFLYVDEAYQSNTDYTFVISQGCCKALGFLHAFFSTSYCVLNTVLIHNFYTSIQKSQKSFAAKLKAYMILTLILSTVVAVVGVATSSGIGFTSYGFCSIRSSSPLTLFAFVPLCLSYPFGLFTILKSVLMLRSESKEHKMNALLNDPYEYQVKVSFIKSNIGFIIVFFVTWLPFFVSNLAYYFKSSDPTSDPLLPTLSLNLLCTTSFFMMVVRLGDPIIRKILRKYVERIRSRLRSGRNREQGNVTHKLKITSEPIVLQDSAGNNQSLSAHPRAFTDPQLTKFRALAPRVGCYKYYESTRSEDLAIILAALENVMQIQDFDSEPPRTTQTPWPQFYYSEICVREITIPIQISGETVEDKVTLNAIVHAPRVFDDLLHVFEFPKQTLINCISLERNKEVLKKGLSNKKSDVYKQYQFLTSNKEILLQRMEKEQKFGFIESFISAYHHHMAHNPNSFLQKILGLYSFTNMEKKFTVLAIKNVYRKYYNDLEEDRPTRLLERIVLDGHYFRQDNLEDQGRLTRRRKYTISLKLPEEEVVLKLSPNDRTRLIHIIQTDLEFLEKVGILDYKINFLLSKNNQVNGEGLINSANSSERSTYDDSEFLSNLTTADDNYKIEIFISLESFIHSSKSGFSNDEDSSLFSRANPKTYRQCIEEFLVQYL